MAKLGPTLKLTDAQKASVSSSVNDYLQKKANTQPLAQMAKFLKTEPKAGGKTNPLSAIF